VGSAKSLLFSGTNLAFVKKLGSVRNRKDLKYFLDAIRVSFWTIVRVEILIHGKRTFASFLPITNGYLNVQSTVSYF
jgi:hypothetical protein